MQRLLGIDLTLDLSQARPHQHVEAPIYRMVQTFVCYSGVRGQLAYLAAAAFLLSARNSVNAVLISVAINLGAEDVRTGR